MGTGEIASRSTPIPVTFAGFQTTLFIEINTRPQYQTKFQFSLMNKVYDFDCHAWASGRFSAFLEAFYEHHRQGGTLTPEFTTKFGRVDEEGNFDCSPQQKRNAAIQFCLDTLENVAKIFMQHGSCINQYAIWYRERRSGDSYRERIGRVACHFIIHTEFISPGVTWRVVEI